MTQRILVVLDPDSDTPIAIQTAVDIAKRYDAEVTGLALIDRDAIEAESAGGGIGSMYFAKKLRETLTDETRARANELIRQFTADVEAQGVRHTGDRVGEEGLVRSLLDEMRTHDLLVAGRESHFYYAEPERRTHTLARVVEAAAAATLIVGTEPRPILRVAVAYDGSTSAARALQKFAHLRPFGTDLDVEVVHVRGSSSEDRLASESLLVDATSYLTAYGFGSVISASVEGDAPADRIASYADGTGADLVVAGAYTKSGFRKLVFGSSTTKLLDEARVPLFLYH